MRQQCQAEKSETEVDRRLSLHIFVGNQGACSCLYDTMAEATEKSNWV